MSFFDNKDKHLLSPDQELTFLGILSECERNADYFTSETYQEVIFDNFHEYINFYISKKHMQKHYFEAHFYIKTYTRHNFERF